MEDNNKDIMRRIIESNYDDKTVPSLAGEQRSLDKANYNKMKAAYDSCMNEGLIKAAGVAPLRKILDEFEKQFPVASPAGGKKSTKDELTSALIWLAQHKFSDLISVTMQVSVPSRILLEVANDRNLNQTDPKTPTVVGIYISGEEDADLSKEERKKTALVNNYNRMIAEMMEVVRTGNPWSPAAKVDAKALANAKKITTFQTRIARILPDQEALSDLTVSATPENMPGLLVRY
jgi:endothelin-converting enzyme